MTEFILPATLHLFEPLNIILMLAGLTGGIIIGALPGLSATMGVALMVPATFAMNPTSGLIMLGAIYAGAIYGGANSAILICTPGTPSSVATTFDGWPLCQKGRADLGLYTSLLSSAFGGIVGTLFLLCLGGSLARFALQFGGPESFWLCLFGLSTIAVMTPDNMGKGIVSGAVGILVSTIGLDPNTGAPRFTFGTYDLLQGVSVIPCMIGLFSFSQVLYLIGTDKSFIAEYHPHKGAFGKVFRYLAAHCKTILVRSSVLGTWIGMLPGAGGEIASIISYNESKRWDKDPSRYGKGSLEGVAASESANNAVIGGSLIPMLTLGIPGSAVAAVILGALMAHGIQPGRGPSGSRAACLRLRSLSRNGVSKDKSSAAMSTLLIEPSNMTDIRPPSTERDKSTLFPRFSSIIGPRMTPRAIAPVSMPTLPPKNPTSPKASTTHMSTRLLLMA